MHSLTPFCEIKQRQQTAKFWYDKTAESLQEFQIGQGVCMQLVEYRGQWTKTTVFRKVIECSYLAQTEECIVYQRNRKFRKAVAYTEKGKEPSTTTISGKVEAPLLHPITATETPNPSNQ